VLMDEINEITDHIQQAAGSSADVIWGYCKDEALGDKVRITVIATGFDTNPETGEIATERDTRTVIPLSADLPTMITQPILNPVEASAPAAPVAPPEWNEPVVQEPYLKPVEAHKEPTPALAAPPQRKIEFEVDRSANQRSEQPSKQPEVSEKKVFDLYDSANNENGSVGDGNEVPEVQEAKWSQAEHLNRVEQRISKVRELNQRLRTPNGLNDLEREPAYKRKNITLNETTHSTASDISRYTLSEGTDENGDRKVELKRNNGYLHDNVD
ncbi:MAG TPA: hypothetical protein PLE78_11530, partial [Flavobacteriales bacterium]|nr:hypothetical protein [Flavobacteriales bacterium]